MSTPEPYVYRLKAVAKVVDGDTLDLDLDLGFPGAHAEVAVAWAGCPGDPQQGFN